MSYKSNLLEYSKTICISIWIQANWFRNISISLFWTGNYLATRHSLVFFLSLKSHSRLAFGFWRSLIEINKWPKKVKQLRSYWLIKCPKVYFLIERAPSKPIILIKNLQQNKRFNWLTLTEVPGSRH